MSAPGKPVSMSSLVKQLNSTSKKMRTLAGALLKHGQHGFGCRRSVAVTNACTCGFGVYAEFATRILAGVEPA